MTRLKRDGLSEENMKAQEETALSRQLWNKMTLYVETFLPPFWRFYLFPLDSEEAGLNPTASVGGKDTLRWSLLMVHSEPLASAPGWRHHYDKPVAILRKPTGEANWGSQLTHGMTGFCSRARYFPWVTVKFLFVGHTLWCTDLFLGDLWWC